MEKRVEKKNHVVGVLLFIFFWWVGADRFYYNNRKWWAYLMIVLNLTLIGIPISSITWVVSLVFLVMDVTEFEKNRGGYTQITTQSKNGSGDNISLRFNLSYFSNVLLWIGIFLTIGGGFMVLLCFAMFTQSSMCFAKAKHDASQLYYGFVLLVMGFIFLAIGIFVPLTGFVCLIISTILGFASNYKEGRTSAFSSLFFIIGCGIFLGIAVFAYFLLCGTT